MSDEGAKVSDAAPLWAGYRRGELLLPWCTACGRSHMPPGPICPHCLGEKLEWRRASGRGVLATWVVERRKWFEHFEPPYAIGHIELEEESRIVASLDIGDVARFRIGAAGAISFYQTATGVTLPIFVIDEGDVPERSS